jgi:soluble lytic murein transglycosylase-like protein
VAAACAALFVASGCGVGRGADANQELPVAPPAGFQPVIVSTDTSLPATDPSANANGPSLEMRITRSMLYAAAIKHHVNPYLVMGLAWHESGWQPTVVSSAGAVGIMQVMPATAAVDGPWLLHRYVNLYDPGDNIDLGTAILKNNLDSYGNDLAKALTAYYAGGGLVTDWAHLRADCRRYVWAVYNAAIMFEEGHGPA